MGLLDVFRNLDGSVKAALSEISSPRLLALAALELAQTEAGTSHLSAEHIVACLEAAGVAVKRLSIQRSLAGATGLVSYGRLQDEMTYRIMTKGRNIVSPHLSSGSLTIVRIEQGKPRSARESLKAVLSSLTGAVRICDPYYGIRTLDALDNIPTKCSVKFLSVTSTDKERKWSGALKDFKRERPNVELRVVDRSAGLHDRYVVTDSEFILLGHGLKDIGNKESFVIRLDKSHSENLICMLVRDFDTRWSSATPL